MLTARNWVAKIDWRIWTGVSLAVGTFSIGFLIFLNMQVNEVTDLSEARDKQISQLEEKSARQEAKLADVGTALEGQIRQFEQCKNKSSKSGGCDKPVAPKPELIIGQEDRESSTPSLQALLVVARQAQREYCSENRCTGRDGKTPSTEQLIAIMAPMIARYVDDYCASRNECRGEPGTDGSTGPKGDTGDKGDAGDPGRTGDTGPKGDAGPSCPDGYQTAPLTVETDEGQRTILACQPIAPEAPAGE